MVYSYSFTTANPNGISALQPIWYTFYDGKPYNEQKRKMRMLHKARQRKNKVV